MDPKIVIYALGLKGLKILKASEAVESLSYIHQVIVGSDRGVENDYADTIIDFCKFNKLVWVRKDEHKDWVTSPNEIIAIAAGWRWMINESYRKIIIIHDSLLPRYRGFNPLVSALLAKDPIIGITALLAEGEYDCGPIVGRRELSINYPIKVAEVTSRIADLYFDLACEIFESLGSGKSLIGVPQDHTKATYSIWRDEEDYRVNWRRSAEDLRHFINCVGSPYRGASARYENCLIRIHDAEIDKDVELVNRDVGKVIFIRDNQPVIICGIGLLRLTNVTDENGFNALPFKKFRIRLN